MLADLAVQPVLRLQVGVPVFHARQCVKVCLALRLGEAPLIFFLLADVRVDIDDTDDHARAFLLLDDGCPKLYMAGPPIQHKTIADREDAVTFDFRHHIFLCQHLEESLLILRIDHNAYLFPGIGKEIRSLPGAGEVLKAACCAVFEILTGFRDDRIEAEEITDEGPEPRVGNLFFLHPFRSAALLHFLIDIRNANDDKPLIVLHARNLHPDICRPVFRKQAIGHHEGVVALQRLQQRMSIHRPREHGTVIGIDILIDLNLAFLKKVPTAPRLDQSILRTIRDVFDILLCVQVHIIQVSVALGE